MRAFSVIIPWLSRPELRNTLEANAELFERYSAEVIIVNCGGNPDEVTSLIQGHAISSLRQIVLPEVGFNKCLANNLGILSSSGRFIFFLDADIALESDVFARAGVMLPSRRCFIKIRRVRESQPTEDPNLRYLRQIVDTRDVTFRDGRKARLRFVRGGDGSRCGSGLLFVTRRHMLAVGGFNSALNGWGFEDLDLQIRLQVVMKLSVRVIGTVVHITHGDEKRNIRSGSRHEDATRNMQQCFESYSRGIYTGSYEEDARTWQKRLVDGG